MPVISPKTFDGAPEARIASGSKSPNRSTNWGLDPILFAEGYMDGQDLATPRTLDRSYRKGWLLGRTTASSSPARD